MVAIFSTIYDRVLLWAQHPKAMTYLVIVTIAEAIFFPIPPDVMLAPMVLANRAKAWMLALVTTLASVFGGLVGYLLGFWALELVLPLIERAGYGEAYLSAVDAFDRFGIWFVILAGFSPIPFKLITVAAGALAMPWLGFIVGSLVGRGARFFMVAGIIYAGGARAAEHLRAWVDRIGWAVVVAAVVIAVVLLAGCRAPVPAPVEHRSGLSAAPVGIAPATYAVRSGDSLYSIAFRFGLDWRDVARWNGINAPYTIQTGDRLRLRKPVGPRVAVDSRRASPPATRPLPETQAIAPPPSQAPRENDAPRPKAPRETITVEAPAADAAVPTRRVAGVEWRWPLAGMIGRPFNPEATRQGLGINGQRGDVITAAADGQVVYSGTALIGYGELLIIKPSPTLLSAYGYNSKRLVEEGMRVEAGAPIAEIGQNIDGDWQLHFEIRKDGQAADPRTYLPNQN